MSILTTFFGCSDLYIETGLGNGQSFQNAADHGFDELHGIELDDVLAGNVVRRMAGRGNAYVHVGSSPDVLPRLMRPERQMLFWLDAHYAHGLYSGSVDRDRALVDTRFGQCPLLAELAIITAVNWQRGPLVLIDDAQCFEPEEYRGPWTAWDRAQFPRPPEIQAALPGWSLDRVNGGSGWFYVCRPPPP